MSADPITEPEVRVLTVDDQARFRCVARQVIDATSGFVWVGEAESGEEALAEVARLLPDLVLLDFRMPGMDGVEVASRLLDTHPEVRVVLITIEDPLDVPTEASLGRSIAVVRKQDFGPKLLRRVWSDERR